MSEGDIRVLTLPTMTPQVATLMRGTFPATFFLACVATLDLDGVALEKI
jgi:hypothetical protein